MSFFSDVDFGSQRARNNTYKPKKKEILEPDFVEPVKEYMPPISYDYAKPDMIDVIQQIEDYKAEVATQSLSIVKNLSDPKEMGKLDSEELGNMVKLLKMKIKQLNGFIKKSRYQGEEDELNNLIG